MVSNWKGSVRRYRIKNSRNSDLPTAAFRLLVVKIRKTVNSTLSAQARILAMLANEPSTPTKGIPQEGLTPTGADLGSADTPVRTVGAWCSSCDGIKSDRKPQVQNAH